MNISPPFFVFWSLGFREFFLAFGNARFGFYSVELTTERTQFGICVGNGPFHPDEQCCGQKLGGNRAKKYDDHEYAKRNFECHTRSLRDAENG